MWHRAAKLATVIAQQSLFILASESFNSNPRSTKDLEPWRFELSDCLLQCEAVFHDVLLDSLTWPDNDSGVLEKHCQVTAEHDVDSSLLVNSMG